MIYAILAVASDHDIIIETYTKVELIYTLLSNHLEHHFVYTVSAAGFAITMGLFALKLLLSNRRLKKK